MEEAKKESKKKFRENIFTKSVRAGKRTYYFDVKETKNGERYVTLTERKRRYNADGSYKVEKHKIFLYREDFEDFADALDDIIEFVQSGKEQSTNEPDNDVDTDENIKFEESEAKIKDYSLDSFEDLEELDS
jgi:hypothetical protein